MPDLPAPFVYPETVDPRKVLERKLVLFGFDVSEAGDVSQMIAGEMSAEGVTMRWDPKPADLVEIVVDGVRRLVCPHCLTDEYIWYDEDQAEGRPLDHAFTGDGAFVISGAIRHYDDSGSDTPGIVCKNYPAECRIDFPLTIPEGTDWELEWGS